jgi:hypothetical protein
LKPSIHLLNRLEEIFSVSDYILRYEKGNFKSGFCILNDQKIIVVNKFYALDGKINCLIEILRSTPLDTSAFNDKHKALYLEITQTKLSF